MVEQKEIPDGCMSSEVFIEMWGKKSFDQLCWGRIEIDLQPLTRGQIYSFGDMLQDFSKVYPRPRRKEERDNSIWAKEERERQLAAEHLEHEKKLMFILSVLKDLGGSSSYRDLCDYLKSSIPENSVSPYLTELAEDGLVSRKKGIISLTARGTTKLNSQ